MNAHNLLDQLGIGEIVGEGMPVHSPIHGMEIGKVAWSEPADMTAAIGRAQKAFEQWRQVPAPVRGEFVRLIGEELRAHKDELGLLVTLEAGKILAEGTGEVQEMIDICDFAVGLSRQLYGLTIASERPGHKMTETWQPLGPVGVISAFNFPVAVWSWNAALAFVCGDPVIWKPSEKTPLTALSCLKIVQKAAAKHGGVPADILSVLIGGADVGEALAADPRVPLISATGSTAMGKKVAPIVAARLGRTLLELGGNNAAIVAPSADLELARRAIVFSAVGTAGQRCTTLRRLIVHESIKQPLLDALRKVYATISVGNPAMQDTLVGPLVDERAYDAMQQALDRVRAEGGTVYGGERVTDPPLDKGYYVRPAIAVMPTQTDIMRQETFAPILYVVDYGEFEEAVALQNDVPQGLSSCIFTTDMREAERFLSAAGSDCGIANVNIGPSGAEIGGAFGGEKETGGGRESGSDAWKSYMRRQTATVNYSDELPLAQGISFDAG